MSEEREREKELVMRTLYRESTVQQTLFENEPLLRKCPVFPQVPEVLKLDQTSP